MPKSREELLIDNAILRYNREVASMLDEKLGPLVENQNRLETDMADVKKRLEDLEETIKPFTTFRRRMWQGLIFFILGAGIIGLVSYQLAKYKGQ